MCWGRGVRWASESGDLTKKGAREGGLGGQMRAAASSRVLHQVDAQKGRLERLERENLKSTVGREDWKKENGKGKPLSSTLLAMRYARDGLLLPAIDMSTCKQ